MSTQAQDAAQAVPMSTMDRRKAWLEQRRKHYTGTDIAKLFGLSPYGGPIDVYLDKTGKLGDEDEDSAPKRSGRYLEKGILAMYADALGVPIEFADPYELIVCPKFPLLAATLDARWQAGDRRPVDAKNIRYRTEEWGESGSDEVPFVYALQGAAQMAVTETPCMDFAVLFTGQDQDHFTVPRNDEIEARICERIDEFHRRHVLADIPPEVDGSEGWARFLKGARQTKPALLASTPEIDTWAERLRVARVGIDAAELVELECQNHIKAFIGEHAGVEGAWGRISYKQNKDSVKLDAEAYIAELEGALIRADEAAGRTLDRRAWFEQMRNNLTTTKPGARPFKPSFKEAR